MHFRLLGPLTVVAYGQELGAGSPRERIVLAMLLEHERLVSIDRIVDAVWGEVPPESARGQVHICVSAIRKRLAHYGGQTVIETRRAIYHAIITSQRGTAWNAITLLSWRDNCILGRRWLKWCASSVARRV